MVPVSCSGTPSGSTPGIGNTDLSGERWNSLPLSSLPTYLMKISSCGVGARPVPGLITVTSTLGGRLNQTSAAAASATASTPSHSLVSTPWATGCNGTRVISVIWVPCLVGMRLVVPGAPDKQKGAEQSAPSWPIVRRRSSGACGALLDPVAFHPLALHLAGAAHGSGLFTGAL